MIKVCEDCDKEFTARSRNHHQQVRCGYCQADYNLIMAREGANQEPRRKKMEYKGASYA